MKVGIEALGIAVPPTYVAMEELAKARNVEPSKYLEGVILRVNGVEEQANFDFVGHAHHRL